MKKFITGFIIGCMITLPLPVVAKEVYKTLKVKENIVQFKLDNTKKINQKIYIISNNAYVPLKVVGELLKKETTYNSKTNLITFYNKKNPTYPLNDGGLGYKVYTKMNSGGYAEVQVIEFEDGFRFEYYYNFLNGDISIEFINNSKEIVTIASKTIKLVNEFNTIKDCKSASFDTIDIYPNTNKTAVITFDKNFNPDKQLIFNLKDNKHIAIINDLKIKR